MLIQIPVATAMLWGAAISSNPAGHCLPVFAYICLYLPVFACICLYLPARCFTGKVAFLNRAHVPPLYNGARWEIAQMQCDITHGRHFTCAREGQQLILTLCRLLPLIVAWPRFIMHCVVAEHIVTSKGSQNKLVNLKRLTSAVGSVCSNFSRVIYGKCLIGLT